jgi:hypothetical protein
MVDLGKITPTHHQRVAIVSVRQSSHGQLQRNPEPPLGSYEFVTRALELGWQGAPGAGAVRVGRWQRLGQLPPGGRRRVRARL